MPLKKYGHSRAQAQVRQPQLDHLRALPRLAAQAQIMCWLALRVSTHGRLMTPTQVMLTMIQATLFLPVCKHCVVITLLLIWSLPLVMMLLTLPPIPQLLMALRAMAAQVIPLQASTPPPHGRLMGLIMARLITLQRLRALTKSRVAPLPTPLALPRPLLILIWWVVMHLLTLILMLPLKLLKTYSH